MKKNCLRCPNTFESNKPEELLCPNCLEKTQKMDKIELESEKTWDLWRKGEISHEQVQERLNEVVGVETGFFAELNDTLRGLVQYRIPQKAKESYSTQAYFNKLESTYEKVIKETNWLGLWLNCNWLKAPTLEDHKTLENLGDYTLSNMHLILCISLKQLLDADLKKQAQILHAFYKLTKSEINARPSMPQLPETDAFDDYRQNKQIYIKQQTKMEDARRTGEFCPYCDSQNVRSYNREQWKCYSCNKRFRKR